MDCEKANKMERLGQNFPVSKKMAKQFKTVMRERGVRSVYWLQKTHLPDINLRTLYSWVNDPPEMPMGVAERLARAMNMTIQELKDDLLGKRPL